MKSFALVAAAIVAAGAASAQEVAPGKAQIAAQLGLDAAEYALNELVSIGEARRENDPQAEAYFLSRQNRDVRGGVGEVSPGKAQIAALLGVEAAEFSLNELISIEKARRENDPQLEAFYLSHQNREVRGGVGQVSPGKAQLAAILGLNPAEYSLGDLAAIEAERHDDN